MNENSQDSTLQHTDSRYKHNAKICLGVCVALLIGLIIVSKNQSSITEVIGSLYHLVDFPSIGQYIVNFAIQAVDIIAPIIEAPLALVMYVATAMFGTLLILSVKTTTLFFIVISAMTFCVLRSHYLQNQKRIEQMKHYGIYYKICNDIYELERFNALNKKSQCIVFSLYSLLSLFIVLVPCFSGLVLIDDIGALNPLSMNGASKITFTYIAEFLNYTPVNHDIGDLISILFTIVFVITIFFFGIPTYLKRNENNYKVSLRDKASQNNP